ncbi:unnamed protein product [Caretta caretta]
MICLLDLSDHLKEMFFKSNFEDDHAGLVCKRIFARLYLALQAGHTIANENMEMNCTESNWSAWSAPVPTQGAGGSTISGAGGPPPPTNVTSNRRLQQTQAQVDEVVDIMRVNVDKVLERDQKLSELDNRADALQAGASQFETSAAKLKRKYWWKNCKMMIILGVVCAVILIVIIIYFCT